MAFYIVDGGTRVSTPLGALVRGPQVDAVTATPALPPEASGSASGRNTETASYRDGNRPRERQPAFYAQQLMSSPVRVFAAERTASEAWQLMQALQIHHLPLVDTEQRLIGIISDRDLLRAGIANPASAATMAAQPLTELMTQRVISAAPEVELRALAEVMVNQRIGAVPIVDSEHRVIGLVSRTDILCAMIAGAPLELWA